ncbi:MAG: hypothetical protein AB1485_03445 [Candidatus Thermoplasmatota archaeon]
MSELLNDELNLNLLENLCSGVGVSVNISKLARDLRKHRNTIKEEVRNLFEHRIVNPPVYPFSYLYEEYPLIVVARADFPRDKRTENFIVNDKHIFAAYHIRDEEYNTFLIEFHKDMHIYQMWKDSIIREKKITHTETRHPTHTWLLSGKLIIKYKPYDPIYVMEKEFKERGSLELNGYDFRELSFQILKKMLLGDAIRTNEHLLAEKLNVHRRTIERRISEFLKKKIILNHCCRFPNFFVPPEYILVFSLLEIKSSKSEILKAIGLDPHITLAFVVGAGRYNVVIFGAFSTVEEHFRWEEEYDSSFPNCLGATKKVYLFPKMAYPIDQQKVSLGIILQKKAELHGMRLRERMKVA